MTLAENYKKILVCMTPIIPHFAYECLNQLNIEKIDWPTYDKTILIEDKINVVIQINGKKRGLIESQPGISEDNLFEIIIKDEKLKKYLANKEIKRKIYIKDKLLNIII